MIKIATIRDNVDANERIDIYYDDGRLVADGNDITPQVEPYPSIDDAMVALCDMYGQDPMDTWDLVLDI